MARTSRSSARSLALDLPFDAPAGEPEDPTPSSSRRRGSLKPRLLREESWGLLLILGSVFLFACLLVDGQTTPYVGAVGNLFAGILRWFFGVTLSFVPPALLFWVGVETLFGKASSYPKTRAMGVLLVLAGVAGLLALPGADQPELRQATFERAGAMGCFMVEWEGLRLVGQFGAVGAGLILGGMILMGSACALNSTLAALMQRFARLWTWREEESAAGERDELPPKPPKAGRPDPEEEGGAERTRTRSSLFPRRKHREPQSAALLADVNLAAEWEDLDKDVAAAAKALQEQQELTNLDVLLGTSSTMIRKLQEEQQVQEELVKEEAAASVVAEVEPEPVVVEEEPPLETATVLARRLAALDPVPAAKVEPAIPGEEAEVEEVAAEEEEFSEGDLETEAEAEDGEEAGLIAEDEEEPEVAPEPLLASEVAPEPVFRANTDPLPVKSGNPAKAEKPSVNLGQGLAKMFPDRWDGEGTPRLNVRRWNEAQGASDSDEVEKLVVPAEAPALAIRLPQIPVDATPAVAEEADDPLFRAEYDTRPHGPEGAIPGEATPPAEPALELAEEFELPDIDLLSTPPPVDARMTRDEMLEMSGTLVKCLADFGVEGHVTEVSQGPVVTRFEFKPAPGIKVSKIAGLEQDIAMAMRAISVRILAPIPGKAVVGIEVPNKKRQGVYLKELLSTDDFWNSESNLTVALGKLIDGTPYYADLAKAPHLLIAGATGAGKSVCLNTIICSLLYRFPPEKVRLIMVDPKRVELSIYQDIPHLIAPVVCEPKAAAGALSWAVEQMEERYKKLVDYGVRNITGYNELAENPEAHGRKLRGRRPEPMPYMVVIVDELADLMLVAKAEVEESIQRLAQMARAVGIHLILATQRPSVNVITGIIKANFPTRIAFQVSQKVDSRTILDSNGAETLLGRGDMLFAPGGASKPIRIQGAFLSDEEVERVAEWCRSQMGPTYEIDEFEPLLSEKEQRELAKMMGVEVQSMEDLASQDRVVRGTNKPLGKVHEGMFTPHEGGSARAGDEEIDEALVRAAARLILESQKASVSLLQRRLKVGFARAGRLMDMLEEMGVVGPFMGSKPRDIVVDPEAALAELNRLENSLGGRQTSLGSSEGEGGAEEVG